MGVINGKNGGNNGKMGVEGAPNISRLLGAAKLQRITHATPSDDTPYSTLYTAAATIYTKRRNNLHDPQLEQSTQFSTQNS